MVINCCWLHLVEKLMTEEYFVCSSTFFNLVRTWRNRHSPSSKLICPFCRRLAVHSEYGWSLTSPPLSSIDHIPRFLSMLMETFKDSVISGWRNCFSLQSWINDPFEIPSSCFREVKKKLLRVQESLSERLIEEKNHYQAINKTWICTRRTMNCRVYRFCTGSGE